MIQPRRNPWPDRLLVTAILVVALVGANHLFAPLLLVDPLDRYIYFERRTQQDTEQRRDYVELVPGVFETGTPEPAIAARLTSLGYTEQALGNGINRMFSKPAGGGLFCGYTYELWVWFDAERRLKDASARVENACF